ncbi:Zn(II)2Cys6 transcription factor domain-containing protein [Aspergillus ruber CBS 135680]|uniref:Zn(2)-C6 fungal-type domain-containing protein n=1 Tax=Aspergillus ruber (strain CBS 135680) TaxID=1388766 RepID=A0A017S770_ASPRC|nr:uncharacterized protein EURHEDRAFT_169992 [Aspergillus ruber CBS 135680]EYE92888.1 hypothetical protein EURHEDRAFT_169992 [Aspergillus ruber CBS 135680]
MQSGRKTRNRTPCQYCKTSKRKCDRTGSHCSRCRRLNLECIPSTTAEWRVNGINSTSQHAPSPDGVTRTRQMRGANHTLSGCSVELSTSPVPGEYLESEGAATLHSSEAIDCNILGAIADPLSSTIYGSCILFLLQDKIAHGRHQKKP